MNDTLTNADMTELTMRPFACKTFVTETAAPVYKQRPTAFPPGVPKPTCHASFLLPEVASACYDFYEKANEWHRLRMAGMDAPRPKGRAWGLDGAKPEWRDFFAAGGVVIFDPVTGEPSCLTLENYPLSRSLNGDFARREFEGYPDREVVEALAEGVCIKAQNLPFLQTACNLEALYSEHGAEGVHDVASELRKFGTYDDTGWHLHAPPLDRARGSLPTATLPACTTPIGAVPKKGGGTRIVIDMGFPYGKVELDNVTESPLPPNNCWDGVSPYRPDGVREYESAVTLGGGGAKALPPNVASGPSKPPSGEEYTAGGRWPWPREGKSTVVEQATNDLILMVPATKAGLFMIHLLLDFWKCFHQSAYRAFEVIATAGLIPWLDEHDAVADELHGISSGRMAMGGLFASGICQRNGNAINHRVMHRFDARQAARRLTEPESPAVQQWLDARAALPHDANGTQARLAFGGFYSDDPRFTAVGPPSRLIDLIHSFFEVVGPEGLNFKLADHAKWLVATWSPWQGVRMSGTLGIVWLPPDKALRASEDLREFQQGRMVGSEFVKMMGFLNYLADVLAMHPHVNQLLWKAYDWAKQCFGGTDVGAAVVRASTLQTQPITVWRKTLMNTPGTTYRSIVRRAPPSRDNVTVWMPASDACMDTVTVDGVTVAGHLHGGVTRDGKRMSDPPGMGGSLYGRLWQHAFSPAEIEVVTIPVAEFLAAVVGLMVLHHDGALDYAMRVCLEIDAEATPRTALQGGASAPGLLIAHDEFTKLDVYELYRSRLTTRHVFGAGNECADKASRSRNAEAERLVRFLGYEPRWLPVPPAALSYIAAVVSRLRSVRQSKPTPGTCDPAEPGGDAPRFGSPRYARRRAASTVSPPAPTSALPPPARTRSSVSPGNLVTPALVVRNSTRRPSLSPYSVPPDAIAPPALSAGKGSSPRITRASSRLPSPPHVALDSSGRPPARLLAGPSSANAAPALGVALGSSTSDGVAPVGSVSPEGISHMAAAINSRVDHLMIINAASTRAHAFRGDQEELRCLLNSSLSAQARSTNENSLAAELSHIRLYWGPYCQLQRTPYLRPDVASLSYDERCLEEAWVAGFIPFTQRIMPSREGVIGAALPSSILKALRNVRRWHGRQSVHMVSLSAAVRATDGLLRDFLTEHGPLALIPKRKEPLTNEEIAAIFAYNGTIGGPRSRKTLDWSSPEYSSLLAMFHTLAQTGMRKGEVSLAARVRFDKSRLSWRNVRWRIGGAVYDELTPELYARLLRDGGYALLRPPPSKADPFSLHWGPCTIYLRFHSTETINAARELAREEMRLRVPLAERENTPLFAKADGTPWRHQELSRTFHDIVTAIAGENRAKQVSMHSWRVYLACALLSKGASFATIQAMLRWKSEDALRIYARINNFAYADWLSAAQGASVSSVRTTTGVVGALSAPPEPGTLAGTMLEAASEARAMQEASDGPLGTPVAGFQHEWMRRAAQAVGDAVRDAHAREALPEIDAYERVSTLSSSMPSLILAAQRADVEDSL